MPGAPIDLPASWRLFMGYFTIQKMAANIWDFTTAGNPMDNYRRVGRPSFEMSSIFELHLAQMILQGSMILDMNKRLGMKNKPAGKNAETLSLCPPTLCSLDYKLNTIPFREWVRFPKETLNEGAIYADMSRWPVRPGS